MQQSKWLNRNYNELVHNKPQIYASSDSAANHSRHDGAATHSKQASIRINPHLYTPIKQCQSQSPKLKLNFTSIFQSSYIHAHAPWHKRVLMHTHRCTRRHTRTRMFQRPRTHFSKIPRALGEVGGWGRVPFSRNLMSPTPRRKWYLTTGRRAH